MIESIQNLFKLIFSLEPLAIVLNIVLFFALFELVYQLYTYEKNHKTIYRLNHNIKNSFKEKELTLKEEFDMLQTKDGNFDDKNKIRKISKLLNDSGLKTDFPELTAEMFLIIVACLAALSCCIGAILTKTIIAAIVSPIAMVLIIFLLLEEKKNKINKTVEKELLKFVDLLTNMSRTEGNLTEMFGGTIPYLTDPLKTMVTQCYYEMKSTGNTIQALNHFSEKANHKKLKEVVGYLIICAEKDESYENVIFETKESIRSYISYRNEKTEIKKSGLIDLFIMGIGGVIIIAALSVMIPKTINYLFYNIIGQFFIGASLIILIYAIWIITKSEED